MHRNYTLKKFVTESLLRKKRTWNSGFDWLLGFFKSAFPQLIFSEHNLYAQSFSGVVFNNFCLIRASLFCFMTLRLI